MLVVFVLGGMLAGCLLDAGTSGTPCESDADCPVYFACSSPAEGSRTCQPIGLEGLTGSGDDGGITPPPVSLKTDVQPIVQQHCVGCHTGAAPAGGGIDLSSVAATYALVDKASVCNPQMVMVKAGESQNSMLWHKLADSADKCGSPMPLGRSLKDTDTEAFAIIEAWIAQGALNN